MNRSERGSSFQLEGLSSTRPGMVEPRELLARLNTQNAALLRGEEPKPAGLSALQEELWQAARDERLAEEAQELTKSLWEEAIRSRFFPQIPREWEWPFPSIWIKEMLIPEAERSGQSVEELLASPAFIESLDERLLSRFLSESEARALLGEEPPRFRGDTFDFGDCSHEFRHLCALALLLRSERYWLGQFLTRCSYDLAYEALLAASDLCAFDPTRTELRGWFRGAADALEFDRRNGA